MKTNKGAPGIDGMTVEDALDCLTDEAISGLMERYPDISYGRQ